MESISINEIDQIIEQTQDGIILFHKALCPHCKNMEKVMTRFSSKAPTVSLMMVDSEEDLELMKRFGVERVPSLVFVKDKKNVHTKTGLMNPKELFSLYQSL